MQNKFSLSPSNMLLITLMLALFTVSGSAPAPAYVSANDMMLQEADSLTLEETYSTEELTDYWQAFEDAEREWGPMHTWGYERLAQWQETVDAYGIDPSGFAYILPEAHHVPYGEALELAIRGLEIKYGFDRDKLDLYEIHNNLCSEVGKDPYWRINFFPYDMDREDVKIYLTETDAITGRYMFVYAGEYGYG